MTAARCIVLDDRLARHVAAALGLHCRTLAGNGVRVPQELIDLLGACQRVSAGHSGSPLDPGADVLDGGLMQQPRAVDYTEAGRLLGVSLSSVKRLVRDGALPVVNIGGRAPRVRVADIDAFLADLAGDHRQPQETR